MGRERNIVGPDRGLRRNGIARGILGTHRGRPEEEDVGDEVEEEPEGVEGGEVDGGASRSAAADVEEGLGVEGDGPG